MRNTRTHLVFPLLAFTGLVGAIVLWSGCIALGDGAKKPKPSPSEVYGRIQYVTAFPDVKVKVVKSFADLRVQKVRSFADAPGKWEIVDNFPDFKVEIVTAFEDFTIEYVNAFPGVKE